MPIKSGIYVIANAQQRNPVFLENPNDEESIRGHYKPVNASKRTQEQWHWHVIDLENECHSIQNVEHKRYAICGSRAELKDHVMGGSKEQEWLIQATSHEGEYTIGAIDRPNFWMLPTKGKDTPIELSNVPNDRKCWWTFTNVETGAPAKEDTIYGAYLFALKPLPILPFSPLRLDFIAIQQMPNNSISNASRTIAGVCGRLVSLGKVKCNAVCVKIIEVTSDGSDIFFERSYDAVTFEKLRNLGSLDILWEDYEGDSLLPMTAIRGLRANTTKVGILNLNGTVFEQGGQAIIELINGLAKHEITLILTPIQPAWENAFSKSAVSKELKRLYPGYRRFRQEGQFSDYVAKYNETVALPRLKTHPELRGTILQNIPHIIEVLKDEDHATSSAAVAVLSQLAVCAELRDAISQVVLMITAMLKDDERGVTAFALITLAKRAELCDASSQAVLKIVSMLKYDERKVASSVLIQLAEHAELLDAVRQGIPRIIELLEDKNHDARSAAAIVLSKLAERAELRGTILQNIPYIMEALKGEDHGTRLAAVAVFPSSPAELRDAISNAVLKIIEMLKGSNSQVGATASALIELAARAELCDTFRLAIPHILKVLMHENCDARLAAVALLPKLAEHAELRDAISDAVLKLVDMLKGNRDEAEAAASALIKLFERAELCDIFRLAIPKIVKVLLDKNYDARSAAAAFLSKLAEHRELHDVIFRDVRKTIEILKRRAGFFELDILSNGAGSSTPLWWAASCGYDAFVRVLLAQKGIDIDAKDDLGRTPLSLAAKNGHDAVVRLLLGQEGVNAKSEDIFGQTPLFLAASNGHDALVRLLLTQEGVDANSKDMFGWTPLSLAAKNGNDKVVRVLLAQEGINIDSKDYYDRTPLLLAAENGHDAVVRVLLAQEGINSNSKNHCDRTPLSLAAENGHDAVVLLLLAQEGVDVNSRDDIHKTPLSWAAEKGHTEAVRLLLAQEGVNVNPKDGDGRTPRSLAAANGHKAVLRLLQRARGANSRLRVVVNHGE